MTKREAVNVVGTWQVCRSAGAEVSVSCRISFYGNANCVFVEEYDGGQIGRFWFQYEFADDWRRLTLTPINEKLLALYKGRVRILDVMFHDGIFQIIHGEGIHTEYARQSASAVPPKEDRFPVWRNGGGPQVPCP